MRKTTGSYCTYSSLEQIATLVPEFAMEDLSLGITAALVPEFAVKDLLLGITLINNNNNNNNKSSIPKFSDVWKCGYCTLKSNLGLKKDQGGSCVHFKIKYYLPDTADKGFGTHKQKSKSRALNKDIETRGGSPIRARWARATL